ncbi:hypothetical protein M405DRAFT_881596 [Rhizopogon salebrosus TDB-379]|nr:hypothetical protein M405DRAFT_881596 [Rhizopogon salebrosus TDB-379]
MKIILSANFRTTLASTQGVHDIILPPFHPLVDAMGDIPRIYPDLRYPRLHIHQTSVSIIDMAVEQVSQQDHPISRVMGMIDNLHLREDGLSQLPIFLISVSESSKLMDDSDSTLYQLFLLAIAISHLPPPQNLETLHHHHYKNFSGDELRSYRSEVTSPRAGEHPDLHEIEWTQPIVKTGQIDQAAIH